MGQNTHIQWCDHTFNPWEGCTKVSPGCAHCYAETRNARFGGGTAPNWGKGAPRRRTSVHNWNEPRRWNREMATVRLKHEGCTARRPRVFCASLADWLDDEVPVQWLADLLALIQETPHLDWLLLTKRPENWLPRIEEVLAYAIFSKPHHAMLPWLVAWHPLHDSGGGVKGSPVPPANVWIGTTVENQAMAEERIPELISIPAVVKFLSVEPMLGPIDITDLIHILGTYYVQWVIIGGESGPGARPFHTEHAWDLLLQCRKAGVAPFVKQLGANPITSNANAMEWPDTTKFIEVESGSQAAGASVALVDKKGGDQAEWPEELRVQEFPK